VLGQTQELAKADDTAERAGTPAAVGLNVAARHACRRVDAVVIKSGITTRC
jgi:hypothetical protein